jgi:hypothetical protein
MICSFGANRFLDLPVGHELTRQPRETPTDRETDRPIDCMRYTLSVRARWWLDAGALSGTSWMS